MSEDVKLWLELIFRWVHVVAGVMWIGHLYFFNFVNAQVAKTYDAESKKKVVPELMPRALYWFRWGAAYTWITGFLLLVFVYYIGARTSGNLVPLERIEAGMSPGVGHGLSVGLVVVGWVVYDMLWKALEKNENVGIIVSFLLVAGVIFGISQVFTPRAVYIHLGGMFGTIMAANVWMRIWPAQRRIISAIKAGTAPDGALVARAGLRSKHNTYMSVPLIFTMISIHYTMMHGPATKDGSTSPMSSVFLIAIVAVGWGLAKLLYSKSGTPVPAQFEPSAAAASPPGGKA
ncbi:MAG TPA: urate hydroxylase PuuD [Polyangiaceae bacterium]|nr:urate hydroxylase PuuD [Polyangiaceae bacterium]